MCFLCVLSVVTQFNLVLNRVKRHKPTSQGQANLSLSVDSVDILFETMAKIFLTILTITP